MFGFIIYMLNNPKLTFVQKQILFILFSIITGLLLSLAVYAVQSEEIVDAALISTAVNFIAMLLLGLAIVYLGYNLEWMGLLLFIALLILIVVRIITLFVDEQEFKKINRYMVISSIVIFSLYILYDTNTILLRYKNTSKSDCIKGALDYYLDIINLFTNYLSANE